MKEPPDRPQRGADRRELAPLPEPESSASVRPRSDRGRGSSNPRPLVVRFGAMGDMVMLTALTRLLARRFGAPCDVVASQGSPQLVFRELDSIGDVFTVQSRRRPFWFSLEQQELVRQLRRRGPSPTFVLDDLPKVHWLLRRADIPERLIVRPSPTGASDGLEPRGDLEHLVDFAARLGRCGEFGPSRCFVGEPSPRAELATSQAERNDCARWLAGRGLAGRQLVLLQPLSRRRRRGRWPIENWRRLALAITDRLPEARLLLTGSPEEAPLLAELERSIAVPAVRSVAPDLPLRRLFALLEVAHSCVSIDTGPAQAAAALGCPLVVLFGRADPRRNAPRGDGPIAVCCAWPRERWPATRREWEGSHAMAEISPQSVIDAWTEVTSGEVAVTARPGAAL
ncbi:MAG: hypothetical protein DWQ36_08595 [Acidobacteria bacterium]|nr:MAG: hypothetical protein DWQ30_22810 [Acidobacteriota bacterium]REK08702.1 MAG: hypothetical protein DWQ36_08595 [Acidobacteriota bacterium]